MCGRFALFATVDELVETFGLSAVPDGYRPSWNIGPGRDLLALVADPARPGKAKAATLRWGFPPAPGSARSAPLVNARVETADRLATFREAYARRRCLIPANGFYEWKKEGPARVPYYISSEAGGLFAMAGICTDSGACAILTGEARGPMRRVHNRMPVVMPPAAWPLWLAPAGVPVPPPDPGADDDFSFACSLRPVPPLVNRAAEDGPELLGASPEQATLDLDGGRP